MIREICRGRLETTYGIWEEIIYYDGKDEHIALVHGEVNGAQSVPCRVHSACISAHVFNSTECDCREQMALAQNLVKAHGFGVIVYLEQDGRGNGHVAKVASESLKRQGLTQSAAYERLGYIPDGRNFTRAAEILRDLGVGSVSLITNNPAKASDLHAANVTVSGIIPAVTEPMREPSSYAMHALKNDKLAQDHSLEP